MQLLLNFVANERAGLLINPKIRQILESAIFEPRDYALQMAPVLRVPVAQNERSVYLSTPMGLLHHEMSHAAESILNPLARLCSGVVALCTGNFDSRFVPILLFIVRVVTRIKMVASEHWPEGDGELKGFMHEDVPRLLRFWLAQAEVAEETALAVQFHSHLALLYGSNEIMDSDTIRLYVCSVAYVVSWHSEGAVEKSETQEERDEEQDLFAMLTGGGAAPDPNANPYPGDGVVNAVMALYEKHRSQVVAWASESEPEKLDMMLSQLVGVALQGGMASDAPDPSASSTRGWDLVTSRPLHCTTSVESPHPYPSNWRQRDEIHFPGVEYISLFFDSRTTTEVLCDCVTVKPCDWSTV